MAPAKVAILHESDEGTMHEVCKIAVAEPWGTEGKTGRQNEYSIISKSESYMLDASLGNKQDCWPKLR